MSSATQNNAGGDNKTPFTIGLLIFTLGIICITSGYARESSMMFGTGIGFLVSSFINWFFFSKEE